MTDLSKPQVIEFKDNYSVVYAADEFSVSVPKDTAKNEKEALVIAEKSYKEHFNNKGKAKDGQPK